MSQARFSPTFFRIVAVCSFVSAGTTLLLIFLPRFYAGASTFDERVALHAHPVYTARLWAYFVHPFFVLMAAWGVAVRKFPQTPGSASTGFVFFLLWAFTEMVQQALSIVAQNQAWRAGYAGTSDEALRQMLRTNLTGFEAVWDALFLVILVSFLLASFLYGVAMRRGRGLERVLSVLYFAAAGLTVLILLENFAGWSGISQATSWIYPLFQPLARTLIGVWLWKSADKELS